MFPKLLEKLPEKLVSSYWWEEQTWCKGRSLAPCGPSLGLRPAKTADVVQEVFAPEGQVKEGYSRSQGGVALQRTVSPGGTLLNELHTDARLGRA
jgi:hypothetical protein